jgi:hypothetical protein
MTYTLVSICKLDPDLFRGSEADKNPPVAILFEDDLGFRPDKVKHINIGRQIRNVYKSITLCVPFLWHRLHT